MKKNFEIPFAESKKLSMKELKQINGGDDEDVSCGNVESCPSNICDVYICWDNCEVDTSEGLM